MRPAVFHSLVAAAFALVVYLNAAVVFGAWGLLPGPSSRALALGTLTFSLLHAARSLGARRALTFFALSAAISWAYEQAGVATGMVYGKYHYTGLLGPKLGHVPVLIPLAWFAMIYPAYVIARLLVDGAAPAPGGTWSRHLWRAGIAGMVMTAWDLVMDPHLVRAGAWVWDEPGLYFGVPPRNFLGWMLTTVTIYFLYGWWQGRQPERPTPAPWWLESLPPLVYAAVTVRYVLVGEPPALAVIAFFAMGLPCLVALGRHWDRRPAP